MQKIELSIVIPIYNGERYIEACLDSILIQSFKNFEIIIINDGSTDNSLKICEEYSKKYSNIKLFSKKNGGVSDARNKALKYCNGKYIYFMDADDTLCSDALKIMISEVENYDLLTFNWHNDYVNNKIAKGVNKELFLDKITAMKTVVETENSFQGYLWNKLFLSKIIKDNSLCFNEKISICEDLLFVVNYLEHCQKIHSITDCLYNYRMRIGACSKQFKVNKFKSMFLSFDLIIKVFKNNKIKPYVIEFEYLYNYYLYQKIFKQNNIFLDNEISNQYRKIVTNKDIDLKKRKDLFLIKNFIYIYKIFNRIGNKFKKKYIMYE